jgi:hypothetical protein
MEGLSRECERLRKDEHIQQGVIKNLRINLKVVVTVGPHTQVMEQVMPSTEKGRTARNQPSLT